MYCKVPDERTHQEGEVLPLVAMDQRGPKLQSSPTSFEWVTEMTMHFSGQSILLSSPGRVGVANIVEGLDEFRGISTLQFMYKELFVEKSQARTAGGSQSTTKVVQASWHSLR